MNRVKLALVALGVLGSVPAFAQYNMELTGVGNGVVADGVYVSPYVGTAQGNGVNYSGYMICDDFNTESYLNTPWTATATNAGALNGSEKFTGSVMFEGLNYSAQQAYDAAGWLASGLLGSLGNSTAQINYSFAIWDIFDGQQTNPAGGALSLEQQAFAAAAHGYVASNVNVYTPNPLNSSQEFLVVAPMRAPELDPATGVSGLTLLLGGIAVIRGRRQAISV